MEFNCKIRNKGDFRYFYMNNLEGEGTAPSKMEWFGT